MTLDRKTLIINKLREQGFRLTSQRNLLIDVILENECSSCKEIYYQAVSKDDTVGIATVYRMVKMLEDLEVINRKNLYHVSYENLKLSSKDHAIVIKDEVKKELDITDSIWFQELQNKLKEEGYLEKDSSLAVVVKVHNSQKDRSEDNDQLYYSCECDNYSCGYNSKRNQKFAVR